MIVISQIFSQRAIDISDVIVASGVDFLGWVHFSNHRVLRTATKHRMLKKIQKDSKPGSRASYKGMLSHGDAYKLGLYVDDMC